VAHGATGKGNDQVRFELTVMALNPRLAIIAPWREWHIRSREDALKYAAEHSVPVTATLKSIYSRDRNLWHLSHEGGGLENPWNEPSEEMFMLTVNPAEAPDEPEYVEVTFEQGIPKQVNGISLGPVDLVSTLNELGGKHGVGRIDIVENRLVGMKSRGVYETPGGSISTGPTKDWSSSAWTSRRCSTSKRLRSSTPSWCTTASGSPRCAKRWTPLSP